MDLQLPPEFFAVHHDLPREGPGTDASTLEALRRLPPLPSAPRVLDLGCGPGASCIGAGGAMSESEKPDQAVVSGAGGR